MLSEGVPVARLAQEIGLWLTDWSVDYYRQPDLVLEPYGGAWAAHYPSVIELTKGEVDEVAAACDLFDRFMPARNDKSPLLEN